MPSLDEVLESTRPAIEAALADAQAELAKLNERRYELEQLITRGKAVLGETHIVAAAPAPGRMTLHGAIQLILSDHANNWMTVKELAAEVNDRSLYQKRDGAPVEPNQIHARAKNYPALFEKDGPRVRLKIGNRDT